MPRACSRFHNGFHAYALSFPSPARYSPSYLFRHRILTEFAHASLFARLWDAVTGKPVGQPLRHRSSVSCVAFSPDGKTVLTGSYDHTARLWDVPVPLEGDIQRIKLWVEVLTGTELDEHGAVRVLDADTWQERRRRLDDLGGPPLK